MMEWIDTRTYDHQSMALLGRKLAELHRAPVNYSYFGLEINNNIGLTPQKNQPQLSWVEFFKTQRLAFQVQLAQVNGLLPASRRQRLDHVIEHLDHWIYEPEFKSILHGDLWAGNVLLSANGDPVIVDPAVYIGSSEADLAFTGLFGGFSASFYSAYQEMLPLQPGYKTRRDLYNLYHLLNHLNLFGEPYGFELDEVLRQF